MVSADVALNVNVKKDGRACSVTHLSALAVTLHEEVVLHLKCVHVNKVTKVMDV